MKPKFTLEQYKRNEDLNNHTLNALMLVKKYGTQAEIEQIERINANHERRGHILQEEIDQRHKISNKYYILLKNGI